MLFLLSPAKSLNEKDPAPHLKLREPELLEESAHLVKALQELSQQDLEELMKISPKLAALNYQRFQEYQTPFTPENAKPALYLFKGDVYAGLDAYTLKKPSIHYLEEHLAILSGLYGALRPLDLIQPYRLEMGTRFATQRGDNLYQFWGDQVTTLLNRWIEEHNISTIVNLASNEYFRVLDSKKLICPIITPIFKDLNKKGEYRVISFYAKKARGMMVRFAAVNQLQAVDELKNFNYEGYQYHKGDSESELLFLRDPNHK